MSVDLVNLVARLRAAGSDWEDVEVKKASGGTPASIGESLSALANHPGGGVIILGLDEADGFASVELGNLHQLKQALAGKARSLHPPVQVNIEEGEVDGRTVVVAVVQECPVSQKPCKDPGSGKAWVRSYDGDYQISSLEEQAFLTARNAPMADSEPVDQANVDDLDPEFVELWVSQALQNRPVLKQFTDRAELLRRTGITTDGGVPTIAGLMVLGRYPQQFFPQLVVRAAVTDGKSRGVRATSVATFDGPIPVILEQAMQWARANFRTKTVETVGGDLVDDTEYPLVAFRELVANALVHRDYSQWARGQAVEIRMGPDGLVIANPGGLYGVTVDRLGKVSITSARNQRIVNLCQEARQPSGPRVIEAIATGIQRVIEAVSDAGLPAPRYWDTGIRFTVRLDAGSVTSTSTAIGKGRTVTKKERVLVELTRSGDSLEISQLAARLNLTPNTVRTALKSLVEKKHVLSLGGRGKRTTYRAVATDKPHNPKSA